MAWLTAIACVGILAFFVIEHGERLRGEKRRKLTAWFVGWIVKGLVLPLGLWMALNCGLFDLPPMVMDRGLAGVGLAHARAVARLLETGVFVVTTYWAAVTSAWLLRSLYQESDARQEFKGQALAWSALLGPVALLIVVYGGWYYLGLALALWLTPLLQIFSISAPETTTRPSYVRAVARMHRDQYDEAEIAVIEELEKCEEDFEGWMLLAELYAVYFHDLPQAERTIRDTCEQAATTESQRSVALQKLADWHLKLGNDPGAARRDLEEIVRTSVNPHLARMAQARIDQLPPSREEWMEQQQGRTIHMPALRKEFAEAGSEAPSGEDAAAAAARARQLADRLRKNPNDARDREELARVMAEKMGKVDAGLEQLELLLTLPQQPEGKVSEWMALMAAWQFKYKRDEGAGRKILERLVRQFPKSPSAFAAQRRLNLLDLEAKLRAARAAAPPPPKISLQEG